MFDLSNRCCRDGLEMGLALGLGEDGDFIFFGLFKHLKMTCFCSLLMHEVV